MVETPPHRVCRVVGSNGRSIYGGNLRLVARRSLVPLAELQRDAMELGSPVTTASPDVKANDSRGSRIAALTGRSEARSGARRRRTRIANHGLEP